MKNFQWFGKPEIAFIRLQASSYDILRVKIGLLERLR